MKTSFPREIFCTVADKIKSWKWSIGNQSKCRWCHHSITSCNQQLSHNDKKYFINKTFHCVKWCIFTVWYCFYLRIWTLLSPAALKSSSEQSKCLCSHLKNSHSQFALFERSTEVKTNEWRMIFKEHQSRMSTDYERRWEKNILLQECCYVESRCHAIGGFLSDWWMLQQRCSLTQRWCGHFHASSRSTRLKFRSFPEIWHRIASVVNNYKTQASKQLTCRTFTCIKLQTYMKDAFWMVILGVNYLQLILLSRGHVSWT